MKIIKHGEIHRNPMAIQGFLDFNEVKGPHTPQHSNSTTRSIRVDRVELGEWLVTGSALAWTHSNPNSLETYFTHVALRHTCYLKVILYLLFVQIDLTANSCRHNYRVCIALIKWFLWCNRPVMALKYNGRKADRSPLSGHLVGS